MLNGPRRLHVQMPCELLGGYALPRQLKETNKCSRPALVMIEIAESHGYMASATTWLEKVLLQKAPCSLTQATIIRTTPLGSLRLGRWLVREVGSVGDLVGWSFGLRAPN